VADLFRSLTTASRSLDAQRYGLDVVGQNMANVNTVGYARRVVDMQSAATTNNGSGGGVDVVAVRALRDRLVEHRLMQAVPTQQREAAMADSLSVIVTALGQPGKSLDKDLQNLFGAFSRLAEEPTSTIARHDVLMAADTVASTFHGISAQLDDAAHDADQRIRGAVSDVNGITEQLQALNEAFANAPSAESVLRLKDQQTQLVRQLTEILDVQVLDQQDGGVTISIGNGQPLVVGQFRTPLAVANTPPLGYAAITLAGNTVTNAVSSGKIGGMLAVRDTNVPAYRASIDTLAFEVTQRINVLHRAGYDQTGTAGGDFFTALGSSTGAAAAIKVDPLLAADGRRIAAGATTAAGDNQVARNLAALQNNRVLNGGTSTMNDAWSDIVYRVGRDTQVAIQRSQSQTEVVRQMDALRDQVSGVSLDEEATSMLKFQRAYEANARFFTTIDQTLDVLMNAFNR
jgi:flagellar hook-associated protein 1 FlgK